MQHSLRACRPPSSMPSLFSPSTFAIALRQSLFASALSHLSLPSLFANLSLPSPFANLSLQIRLVCGRTARRQLCKRALDEPDDGADGSNTRGCQSRARAP